jgi:sugar lactone lactonase YvrE
MHRLIHGVWVGLLLLCGGSSQGAATEVLAEGQDHPTWLVVDRDSVFFAAARGPGGACLLRVDKRGGAPLSLAWAGNLSGLVSDGDALYYADAADGRLRRLAKDGSSDETIADGQSGAHGLSVFRGELVWPAAGHLRRSTTRAGFIEALADDVDPAATVVADASGVSWIDRLHGAILHAPRDGGPVRALAPLPPGGGAYLTSDGVALYFTTRGLPCGRKCMQASSGTVWRLDLSRGELRALAERQSSPGPVAVAGDRVYFGNAGDGTLVRIDASGLTVLARGVGRVAGVAVDAQFVYFTELDRGIVARVAK